MAKKEFFLYEIQKSRNKYFKDFIKHVDSLKERVKFEVDAQFSLSQVAEYLKFNSECLLAPQVQNNIFFIFHEFNTVDFPIALTDYFISLFGLFTKDNINVLFVPFCYNHCHYKTPLHLLSRNIFAKNTAGEKLKNTMRKQLQNLIYSNMTKLEPRNIINAFFLFSIKPSSEEMKSFKNYIHFSHVRNADDFDEAKLNDYSDRTGKVTAYYRKICTKKGLSEIRDSEIETLKNENQFPLLKLNDIWRIFVDAYRVDNELGWFEYEKREPGSINAMYAGWKFCMENLKSPLTENFIKKLHAICGKPGCLDETILGKFKQSTSLSLFTENEMTPLGFLELLTDPNIKLVSSEYGEFILESPEKNNKDVQKLLNNYEKNIGQLSSKTSKLKHIVHLIHRLGLSHPFSNSNCRTICTLLNCKELMRNNFLPVILYNPNRFDGGYSESELFYEIIKGWDNYLEVCETGKLGQNGLTSKEIFNQVRQLELKCPDKNFQLNPIPSIMQFDTMYKRNKLLI